MKTHTSEFKNTIKTLGRQYAVRVTYNNTTLDNEDILNVTLNYKGDILKSVMKQLELGSNIDIPIGTQISLEIGLLVNNEYEYLNYGNFIVRKSEKQENTNSYIITCYDKMLYSMIPYEDLSITYPITIRNYISAICTKLGLTFANASDTFVNYDKQIKNELYLDSQNNDLGYTFRDVLDELAQVTASTICINDNDELEIRYLQDTGINQYFNSMPIENLTFDYSQSNTHNYVYDEELEKNVLNIIDNGSYPTIRCSLNKRMEKDKYYCLRFEYKLSTTATDYRSNAWIGPSITGNPWDNLSFFNANYVKSNDNSIYIQPTDNWKDKVLRFKINESSYDGSTSAYNYILLSLGYGNRDKNFYISDLMLYEISESEYNQENYTPVDYNDYVIDTINEEYLKNVNVNFGEMYGAVNTITLSRSAGSDNISRSIPENLSDDEKIEIKISDNQILNGNNRDEFIDGILNKLYGLSYFINDYSSTGILYYELCDKYKVSIGDETYSCVMLNDRIEINNGLVENIYTDMPITSETNYKKADKTDRKINQTYIIVDKQNGEIEALSSKTTEIETKENNNYQELLAKFDNVASSDDITALQNLVRQIQTDTYTKTEIQQIASGVSADGTEVSYVKTTSATFDEDGMHYEKSGSNTSSTVNQAGITVNDTSGSSTSELLFAGYDNTRQEALVRVANLYLTRYLGLADWRIEQVEDDTYGTGIGFFYLG